MVKLFLQKAISIKRSFIVHLCKNNIKGSITNYQDFSFLDAESLDSGMSLTNATDVRHTDPEFKVFYRISSDIDQWFSALATEAIRAQII